MIHQDLHNLQAKRYQVKRKNLNFAMAYLLGVVLPLLVLAAVLRSERTLVAPVSVGGIWKIQAGGDELVALSCGRSLAIADSSFTISQSGKSFALNFENAGMSSASGSVEGTTLRASMLPVAKWAREARCKEKNRLSFTATVDSSTNLRFLAVVLSANDCPTCAPVHFRAVRANEVGAQGSN